MTNHFNFDDFDSDTSIKLQQKESRQEQLLEGITPHGIYHHWRVIDAGYRYGIAKLHIKCKEICQRLENKGNVCRAHFT